MKRLIPTVLMLCLVARAEAQPVEGALESTPDTSAIDLEAIAADDGEVEESLDVPKPRRHLTWTTSVRYDLERRAGYDASDSTAFHGPPAAFRSRGKLRLGTHMEVVVVTDHDAGEGMGSISETFDFASASISIARIGPINSFVVGAIRPRIGLGLALWSGRRLVRLGMSPGSFVRSGASVHTDGSTYETSVMRGIGLDLNVAHNLRVVAYMAKTIQDAVIDDSGSVTSLPANGLHRNDREIFQGHLLVGRLFGGLAFLNSKPVGLGISIVGGALNRSIARGDRPYQFHRFTGRTWRAASIFLRASFGERLQIAAETAFDDDGTPAAFMIFRSKAGPGLWLHAAWRDYPQRFNALYGAAPSATGSGGVNERGLVIGFEGRWMRHRIRVFRDLYRKPWLQYDSYRPSTFDSWGIEAAGQFQAVRYIFRYDDKMANREPLSAVARVPPFERRKRLRIRLETDVARKLRPIVDVVFVGRRAREVETGEGLGQRLIWKAGKRLTLASGVVFFRSDSGGSGIYLYEPDLPDYFSVPLLTDSGFRTYALLSVRISTHLTWWIKGGLTRYDEERTIGAGVDRIVARQLRSLSLAVRFVD